MSFSSDTKNEICRAPIGKKCCALSEAYGVLLYCNTFSVREIRVVTEHRAFGDRLTELFQAAFGPGFGFDISPEPSAAEGKLIFIVNEEKKLEDIFSRYGYEPRKMLAHHINLGIFEDDCCRVSFMRGAFLAGGSVTNPEKRYHLELATDHYNVSREAYSVLLEMGFSPKDTVRNGNYVIYFKQSEAIEDFLTTVGAPVAAMEIMSAKVEKDLRNSVNRRVNCDTANVSKTVDAAAGQLEAIRNIEKTIGLDSLPQKLYETALLRIVNPEASLSELAELAHPKVSRSCLNHRLRKLIEIAGGI